jgi:Peptidase family M28
VVSHPIRRLGGVAAAAVLLATVVVATPARASSNIAVEDLIKSVTLAGVLRHVAAFQAIASLSGGNRASGNPGYDRSADYVATLAGLAGYRVTRQPFPFNYCEDTGSSFAQNAPAPTTYVDQVDYDVMDCSGDGTATGDVVPVDLSVSYPAGVAFAGTAGLDVTVTTETVAEVRTTENVIAESPWGDPNEVVMAGAHLDSRTNTAGINDNGSGSAGILEVALQLAKAKAKNKVRFAWWGAEEFGLAGSTFYVANLPQAERDKIALYLNIDMIGSPNYTFGVFDGDDPAGEGSGPGPAGSAQIEAVFQAFFAARGEATKAADFTGRSDYGPFIAAGVGIPAGGRFTGAEGRKTEADVALWGGVAGAQYDPCYHQPCDSLPPEQDGADAALYRQLRREYRLVGNINTYAIDTNTDAIATAVATFANDTSTIPPRTAAAAGVPGPGQLTE